MAGTVSSITSNSTVVRRYNPSAQDPTFINIKLYSGYSKKAVVSE